MAPHKIPARNPMKKATYHGYSQVRNKPATMATSPMTEPTERSMPPVMITIVMPIAMMPNGAKLRVMLATLSAVPKLGSFSDITTTSISSATVTQNDWLDQTPRSHVVSVRSTMSVM